VIIVVNTDEEITAATFQAWLDERQQGSPIATRVSAADALRTIRQVGDDCEDCEDGTL
jgi:hypothetical protein